MKKMLFAGAAVLALGVGSYSVYADGADNNESEYENAYENVEDYGPRHYKNDPGFNREENLTDEKRQERFDNHQEERSEYREERIQSALEDGRMTEEEAEEWRTESAERNQDSKENRFSRRGHHGQSRGRRHGRHNRSGGCAY